jgi:hypothetical protein
MQISMNPAFTYLASEFSVLKLRFYIQLQGDALMPSFKGSMLHGWFGHALKAVDEQAFYVLYGNHDQQQPKPYVICPNDDLKQDWHKNEMYHFDIVLFGQACQLAPVVIDAVNHGQTLGLGAYRTAFSLLSVCSVLPSSIKTGIHISKLNDCLPNTSAPFDTQIEFALHYSTPIRIKTAGHIVKQAPSLDEWLNHILRRWRQLSTFWVLEDDTLFNTLYAERPRIGDHEVSAHVYFEDWQRYSKKDKTHLPFGGLKGQVSYCGDIAQALPLLAIGQQLHIGGKTTFGLGAYQLIC